MFKEVSAGLCLMILITADVYGTKRNGYCARQANMKVTKDGLYKISVSGRLFDSESHFIILVNGKVINMDNPIFIQKNSHIAVVGMGYYRFEIVSI